MAKQSGLKIGKFSKEELRILANMAPICSDKDIAKKLNRSVEAVRKNREVLFAKKTVAENKETETDAELRILLQSRYYWGTIKKQFHDDEREFFVSLWISLFKQFNKDVTQTEEDQIVDYCRLEILKNRNAEEQGRVVQRCREIERLIEMFHQQVGQPPYKDKDDNDEYNRLHDELTGLRTSSSFKTDEMKKLLEKQESLRSAMRASRSDRIKVVTDVKKSFHEWVLSYLDDERRTQEGKLLAMVQKATEKERERLSEYHTFSDKTVDLVIINERTMNATREDQTLERSKE